MRHGRRSHKEVLKDKSGLSTSLVETLGGISLKMLGFVMAGGLLAALLTFWVTAASSADTSSGFQTTGVSFEKAVEESDVVVGIAADRAGLLTDTADGKCKVQTWQKGSRDGLSTLQVDTKTVAGACKPTTPLIALGAGTTRQELLFNIKAPVFTYSNLGGRVITFDAAGVPTLATGTKPAAVKPADWDDVRPYSVKLNVETLNEDAAKTARKAELTGVTSVVNVTVPDVNGIHVAPPSTDPVPGPLRITGVDRSETVGTVYSGAREGITTTIIGGVCPGGPTKLTLSYTQQSPSVRPAVTTVQSRELTGAAHEIDLGSVANGSSGAVEVSATCMDGGAVEKDETGYSQPLPTPVVTVKQNAADEKHDLRWPAVSSLFGVEYQIRWTSTNGRSGSTSAHGLSTTMTQIQGTMYGYTSTYWLKAVVNSVTTPESSASIHNSWPIVDKPTLALSGVPDRAVWMWYPVACPAGTRVEYEARYAREDIGERPWSSPTTATSYAVDTQWQGYIYRGDARARCYSHVTGSKSDYSAIGHGTNFYRNVERPTPINWDMRQTSDRNLQTVPYSYCSGGAQLYSAVVEASYDMRWVGGPKHNQTGWWRDQPGWYEEGWGVIVSNIFNPEGPFEQGNRFQVRVQTECWNKPMNRASGENISDSPLWTWRR